MKLLVLLRQSLSQDSICSQLTKKIKDMLLNIGAEDEDLSGMAEADLEQIKWAR